MGSQRREVPFPQKLDGAKVLFYTPQGDYGAIEYPNGEIVDKFCYLAIGQYANDEQFYLFCCNERYEVVSDWVWDSIGKCMAAASSDQENIDWCQM